jgi:hypothetical protein
MKLNPNDKRLMSLLQACLKQVGLYLDGINIIREGSMTALPYVVCSDVHHDSRKDFTEAGNRFRDEVFDDCQCYEFSILFGEAKAIAELAGDQKLRQTAMFVSRTAQFIMRENA